MAVARQSTRIHLPDRVKSRIQQALLPNPTLFCQIIRRTGSAALARYERPIYSGQNKTI